MSWRKIRTALFNRKSYKIIKRPRFDIEDVFLNSQ